jgi:hypothetical protein
MKQPLLIGLMACAVSGLFGQSPVFPGIQGVSLDEKRIIVPPVNGKYSVVAIAFHRNAEDELKKWLNPLYETFIPKQKSAGTLDLAEIHDVNFIFIPMIAGFRKVAEEFKKGTDREFWPYIMDTEKTDVKELQKQLGVSDNKIPYFYVLDPRGKVMASVSGSFSEEKLSRLEEAIE